MPGVNCTEHERQRAHHDAIVRRLRTARPDLHAQVVAGKLRADDAVASLPSPAATLEAKGLAHAVKCGTLSVAEVIALCSISPREIEVATRLGLGRQVRRAQAYRKKVLEVFEQLSNQR